MQLSPLVCLARVDELVPRARQSPLSDIKEISTLVEQAAKALNIPENFIYYSVPYQHET